MLILTVQCSQLEAHGIGRILDKRSDKKTRGVYEWHFTKPMQAVSALMKVKNGSLRHIVRPSVRPSNP